MAHPVFEHRSRLITWWLVWLLLGAGQSLLFYYGFDRNTAVSLTDGMISMTLYSGIALAAWFPLKFINRSEQRFPLLIANLMAISAVIVLIWLGLAYAILSPLLSQQGGYPEFWSSTLSVRLGLGLLLCILVFLTYYLTISYKSLSDKRLDESRLENILKETELRMLRTQINPHFLFNSLNSVSALTISDPDRAREMVIKLSEFMRYALARKDEQPVTLRQELENMRLYIDIEKTRFGERLVTRETIKPDCLDHRIPNLILQPLYENAVKYGVHESTGQVEIHTSVHCDNHKMEITISNNFDREAVMPSGTGTGLNNVRRRLDLVYGREASMVTNRGEDRFTVTLKLPLRHNQI